MKMPQALSHGPLLTTSMSGGLWQEHRNHRSGIVVIQFTKEAKYDKLASRWVALSLFFGLFEIRALGILGKLAKGTQCWTQRTSTCYSSISLTVLMRSFLCGIFFACGVEWCRQRIGQTLEATLKQKEAACLSPLLSQHGLQMLFHW